MFGKRKRKSTRCVECDAFSVTLGEILELFTVKLLIIQRITCGEDISNHKCTVTQESW